MAFWYILWSVWYTVSILASRTKKNLATLRPPPSRSDYQQTAPSDNLIGVRDPSYKTLHLKARHLLI
jgi:hypothetical protein